MRRSIPKLIQQPQSIYLQPREKKKKRFTLYYQMLMFFANGGGTCYVLSAGNYKDNQLLNKNMMSNAINALEKEREITMVVIPEAVHSPDCANIQTIVNNILKRSTACNAWGTLAGIMIISPAFSL